LIVVRYKPERIAAHTTSKYAAWFSMNIAT